MSITNIVRTAGNVQGILGAVANFTQSIVSMFGVDIVGIYDNDTFDQLFQTARPAKANITRDVKMMEHPIETGALRQDFMILQPVTIELSLMLLGNEYQPIYQQIKQYFMTGTPVSIQTKADVFPDMVIQAMPHEETPDMFDAIPLAVRFRQVQQFTVQYQSLTSSQVTQPADQSTVDTGQQQPKTSALYDIGNFIGSIF